MKNRKFIDRCVLYATAGNGGKGSASFRREKFVPKGGPDGGDGGHGGSIILRGNQDVDSLIAIYFAPHRKAGHGGVGRGKRMHGKNGADCCIDVPLGTVIRDKETKIQVGEIISHQQQIVVAKGGKGGLGNVHFKSSTHQVPTEFTPGEPGEEASFELELKIMADIGLVGFPNAGKSSILTAISHAHPKIAAYPFTTMNPVMGTIEFDDFTRLRIADIPGIIEGAHAGVGLGHDFLRHIERSKILLIVLDMAGVDDRNPLDDFHGLVSELEQYDPSLLERPQLVVANKMDLAESAENLATFEKKTGIKPIRLSAQSHEGIEELKQALRQI